MSPTAIIVSNLSKKYELGVINSGTFSQDLNSWWAKTRGRNDLTLKIGEEKKEKEYWALKDVDFDIRKGEAVGIIGKNGAGKSTLLKILSRVTTPTSGLVKIHGRIASLLEVGTGFHPDLSGRENIYMNGAILGMTRKEINSKLTEIVEFSGVEKHIDTPVKRYSSGMYVRLAFAVAAHLDPEILIIDEVLAVGDAEFQKKCLGKLGDVSKEGRTVLFVSHNMAAMRKMCTSGIYLKAGTCSAQGDFESVAAKYESDIQKDLSSVWHSDFGIIRRIWIETVTEQAVLYNQPLSVKIKVVCREPITKPVFGIIIKDFQDIPLVGINNRHYYKNDFNALVGEQTITIKIPALKLLPGGYKMDFFLGSGNADITQIKDCILFNVQETAVNNGASVINYHLNKVYHEEIIWEIMES